MKKYLGLILCLYLSYLSVNMYFSYKHLYLATCYLHGNLGVEAMRELDIATKQNPFNIISRYFLASLYLQQNDPLNAMYLYRDIESRHPNFLMLNYQQAMIYKYLKMYRKAYEELCKAEKLYPASKLIYDEKKLFRVERSSNK